MAVWRYVSVVLLIADAFMTARPHGRLILTAILKNKDINLNNTFQKFTKSRLKTANESIADSEEPIDRSSQ